jgi:hypothetical protein
MPTRKTAGERTSRINPSPIERMLPPGLPCLVAAPMNNDTANHPARSAAPANMKTMRPRKNRERKTDSTAFSDCQPTYGHYTTEVIKKGLRIVERLTRHAYFQCLRSRLLGMWLWAGVIEFLHSDRPVSGELAVRDSVIFPGPVLLGLNPKQPLGTPTE